MIAVQGSIRVDSYTDRDGNKRSRFEVVADNVSFCGSKRETGAYDAGEPYGGYENSYQRPAAPAPVPPAPASSSTPAPEPAAYASGDTGDFQALPDDDDLPF